MSTEEKQTPFEPPPETISIHEVAFMHQIIQACAQRGAFKPEEFKDIGVLNDKFKALIEYAKSLEDAAKETDGEKKDGEDLEDIEKVVEQTPEVALSLGEVRLGY